jgi:hypothetical protein
MMMKLHAKQDFKHGDRVIVGTGIHCGRFHDDQHPCIGAEGTVESVSYGTSLRNVVFDFPVECYNNVKESCWLFNRELEQGRGSALTHRPATVFPEDYMGV